MRRGKYLTGVYHSPTTGVTYFVRKKRYRLRSFVFDIIMTVITHGLWLIWIFVRELRGR